MNLRMLVDSFTLSEMTEVSNIIHEKRTIAARKFTVPLNPEEVNMIENGQWIEAIRMYRNRNECDLITAKIKVDDYRDKATIDNLRKQWD